MAYKDILNLEILVFEQFNYSLWWLISIEYAVTVCYSRYILKLNVKVFVQMLWFYVFVCENIRVQLVILPIYVPNDE